MRPIDITGQRFGQLVAVAFVRSATQGTKKRQFWLFRCDCGNEREMQKGAVTGGKVVSCGCHRRASFTTMCESRRQAIQQAKITPTTRPTSLALEQLANRAAVPPSMQKLPSRIVEARHASG